MDPGGPRRGSILDTNGQTLVVSATAYIVSADPRKVSDISLFTQTVCPILDLSEESVAQKLSDRTKASVILKRQVSREKADELRTLQASADEAVASQLSALLFDEDVRRAYPRGAFLTQTLGLTNVDSVGQSGLELQYESLLRGTAGVSLRSVDGKSQPIYDSGNLYIEPQDGNSIKLTIDATIQEICEKAMRECYDVNKAQAVHLIAMDPYTGAILAMCSKPDYDPNDPPRDQPDALTRLMRIRLISDAYEPGSTFKILTAAAALDAGVTTPEDGFYCSAKITVDGDTIRCWGSPHKDETMAEALQNSCNPVFVELALRLGTERMYQYLHAFGLGSKTNVDLQGEESGILIPVQSVKNVDLARIGFGQSVAVTPIQLITAACAVINGGRLMQPYLLKEAIAPDGTVLYRTQPKVVSNPISEETSATMRELLELVVSEGGAKNAAIEGYRIGGKTGTAQVYKDGRIVRDVHIGSFLGFAPADDPQIAILVALDEPVVGDAQSSTIAAPVVGAMLEDILPYLGYEPSFTEEEEAEQGDVTVGTYVTAKPHEAQAQIRAAGLKTEIVGQGVSVIKQVPEPGKTLPYGGTVILYTDESEANSNGTVPDVVGRSVSDANQLITNAGFNINIVGSVPDGEEEIIVTQEPPAGSSAEIGSIVTVNIDPDALQQQEAEQTEQTGETEQTTEQTQ